MKKIQTLIVIIWILLLLLASCDKIHSIEGEQSKDSLMALQQDEGLSNVDQNAAFESDDLITDASNVEDGQESKTEYFENDNDIEVEPVFTVFENMDEYSSYVNSNVMGDGFIKYEMLSSMGSFECLILRGDGCYSYSIMDDKDCEIFFSVDKLEDSEGLLNEYTEKSYVSLNGESPENFIKNEKLKFKIIIFNNILYQYDGDGLLYCVSFIIDDFYKVWITRDNGFADYTSTEANILDYILSGNSDNIDFSLLLDPQ